MTDLATAFPATKQCLAVIRRKLPAIRHEPTLLVRLVKHLYKPVRDDANALLKPLGINDPDYNRLIRLYDTEGYTLNPSQLAGASGEKSANITRSANESCDKPLLQRTTDNTDRRKVTLPLTKAGVVMIERLLPAIGALPDRHAAGSHPQPCEMAQREKLHKDFLLRPGQA